MFPVKKKNSTKFIVRNKVAIPTLHIVLVTNNIIITFTLNFTPLTYLGPGLRPCMLEFHTTDDRVKDLSILNADHCTVALVRPNNIKTY